MLQYLCAFIFELSIKVKSENSTAMNIGTATHCMLRNLWVFPCSFFYSINTQEIACSQPGPLMTCKDDMRVYNNSEFKLS